MKQFIKKSLILVVLMHLGYESAFSMHFLRKSAATVQAKAPFTKSSQIPFQKSLFKNDIKKIHIFAPKNGKKELSTEIHQKAYAASLKHEFPTAPFYNNNYNSTECETKALTEELAIITSEIEVQWIPRTLYELFIMHHYYNTHVIQHGYSGFLENSDFRPLLEINNHQHNTALHKQINESILAFLHQYPKQKNVTDAGYFIQLAEQLLKNLSVEIRSLENIILNAITYETEIHKKNPNSFLLYRAGPLDKRDFNIQLNYALDPAEKFLPKYISLSFGLGLFAAYFTDVAACTAQICSSMIVPHVYALPVNKNKLCTDTSAFFVPPLAPIPNFFSKGEAFHGRNKIPLTSYEQKRVPIYDGWCTNEAPLPKSLIIENKNLLNPSFHRKAFYKSLYRYIVDKARPLNGTTAKTIEKIKGHLQEE